ncbi:MAG TPA: CheR family methyltransferase, partial [Polyangia bacterium]
MAASAKAAGASTAPPFLVAAVGTSAGGLAALRHLMETVPADAALAVLVVAHLSRTEKSHLAEILNRTTGLEVVAAHQEVRILPGHAYVIPPDRRMTVRDGHLRLSPRPPGMGTGSPIDEIFFSVAREYKERGVGIVLSGTGQDGAAGLREIKAAGGIALVQSPEEAEHDGMPRAAMSAATVDAVLPVARIAEHIIELSRDPFFRRAPDDAGRAVSDDVHLAQIFKLLRKSSGIDFGQYKLPTITRRIQRRIALNRVPGLGDYVALLQASPKELISLQENLLIHVTSFFREPESFEGLKASVIPRLLEGRPANQPFRAWVPGCSTGEEAYSLAIVLLEVLGERKSALPIQIFATDVSEQTVERARAGVYLANISSDVSAERLKRFFIKHNGSYRVNKAVREVCIFAKQDITRDPPFSRLDLIVCRNVLIYLNPEAQRKLMGLFHYALKPHGALVLGRSETIGSGELFTPVDKRARVFAKYPSRHMPDPGGGHSAGALPEAESRRPLHVAKLVHPTTTSQGEWDLQGEVSHLLVDKYAPPGIVVDNDFRIVRTRGRTNAFLELQPGEASLELLSMARPGLIGPLRTALLESRTRGVATRQEVARFQVDNQLKPVAIEVTPLGPPDARHYLVLFEEGQSQRGAGTKRAKGGARPVVKKSARRRGGKAVDARETIEQLEEELAATRAHLQATINDFSAANEELQSANEEILSSNEELQSTNEELDTAKEELQSTNEELSTLNDELEARNVAVTELNSDLVNLVASVNLPILIVTTELRIRRFTPAAEKAFNLIASDIGRPIGHIKPNIDCPHLEAWIRDVIANSVLREEQVEGPDGRLFELQIRPYKTLEGKIEGAVLSLYEMTDLANLRLARTIGEHIMQMATDPILL